MREHFSLRSFIFYAVAIALVVVIFSVTTAYGEKNLKAARQIDGRYPLPNQTLPDCFQAKRLYLLIQQSGVYLTGSILPEDASAQAVRITQERPSLAGEWNDPKLALAGQANTSTCRSKVTIAGTISENVLNGTLRAGAAPNPIVVSAKREAPQPKSEKH